MQQLEFRSWRALQEYVNSNGEGSVIFIIKDSGLAYPPPHSFWIQLQVPAIQKSCRLAKVNDDGESTAVFKSFEEAKTFLLDIATGNRDFRTSIWYDELTFTLTEKDWTVLGSWFVRRKS